jgi:hypothetical protein
MTRKQIVALATWALLVVAAFSLTPSARAVQPVPAAAAAAR